MIREEGQSIPVLPRQPEVNIGTAGHVDHGKCERWDQYALVDGQPLNGSEIEKLVSLTGKHQLLIDGGEFYSFEDNDVVSIDESFQPSIYKAGFYKQRYNGPMISISTGTGRKLSVTPEHPLLINREGNVLWMPSGKLTQGDSLAVLRTVPLPEDAAFDEPIGEMRNLYDLVTWEDMQLLRTVTDDFERADAIAGGLIDKLRILAGLSKSRLCESSRVDQRMYERLCNEEVVSPEVRKKVLSALQRAKRQELSPGEFLVSMKRGKYPVRKMRSFEMGEDLAKWFAFVWSEGSSGENFVGVAQTIQEQMVREWIDITM